jgi:hypothetical protein
MLAGGGHETDPRIRLGRSRLVSYKLNMRDSNKPRSQEAGVERPDPTRLKRDLTEPCHGSDGLPASSELTPV